MHYSLIICMHIEYAFGGRTVKNALIIGTHCDDGCAIDDARIIRKHIVEDAKKCDTHSY